VTDDALRAEALRVNARYVEEVVIGWNLCPWAARAWRDGAVARRVFCGATADAAEIAGFVTELAAAPAISVGLAIFPRVTGRVGAWEKLAETIRRGGGPFLVAAFHPDYRGGAPAANAAQLVSAIRRTPDPTLQFIRASLVDALGRDVSDGVARANFTTVTAQGAAALDALLADIRRDRDASYRD
jgi:hypothetical protein